MILKLHLYSFIRALAIIAQSIYLLYIPSAIVYLQKDNDPILCVLICCYVEHARPVAVHDPIVHLGIRANIRISSFDFGHHGLHWQRLQHCILIVL